jgi:UMP-CMP kinase
MSFRTKYLKYKEKYLNLKNLTGGVASAKANITKPEVIFLLGGPGSGKGTVGDRIVKEFDYQIIGAGDLLRAEARREGSEYGALIKEYQAEGKIVPSRITIGLIKARMLELSLQGYNKFLLDGFPRNKENFDLWNEIVGDSITLKFVIFLNCDEGRMIDRVLRRGQTSGRADDNEETVTRRIRVYNEETLPVIQRYRNINKLREINANGSADEVFETVRRLFM